MKRNQYITHGNKCSTCSSRTYTQCLECKLWVCYDCRDDHDSIAARCVAPPPRPDLDPPDTSTCAVSELHILDNDHWYILEKRVVPDSGSPNSKGYVVSKLLIDNDHWYILDDLHGPEPDPENIEAAVKKVKELDDFSLDVLQSPAVDKGLREIFAKAMLDNPESISNIGNDIVDEHGLTEKAAEIQDRQNRMMRKIHRNTLETKDLRYSGCKCDEKI